MLVFSCHADTGFDSHSLSKLGNGLISGNLDNFIGVHAVMNAYFSGRLNREYVRIELTYGEETDFEGAFEVLDTLDKDDVVIVVDVTATVTDRDFVIEKCRSDSLRHFLARALQDMSYDIYSDCPDPVSDSDEVDVYCDKCANTCFLGLPVFGGDYNAGTVLCKEKTSEIVSEAICRIVEAFPEWHRK